jgi:hypothetical protein
MRFAELKMKSIEKCLPLSDCMIHKSCGNVCQCYDSLCFMVTVRGFFGGIYFCL